MSSNAESAGTMVFHHPSPLRTTPGTGSQLRPVQMRNAFIELGYEVIDVTGYSEERIPRMKDLVHDVVAGRPIDFCYGENVNSATALSDPSHLPKHPLADPVFFRSLQRAGVPTGVFYRDIHWRFDGYREALSIPKWVIANAFNHFDLAWYSRYVDVLFLPDLGMADPIPCSGRFRFEPLPPGAPTGTVARVAADDADGTDPGSLRLMYVGAISAPNYDITPLLDAVASTPVARLSVCCPEAERTAWEQYPARLRSGVELVHLSGDDLVDLYQRSEIACLVYGENPYRDFAMPVKLFEAIGRHTPSISDDDTAAGRFVARHGVGWTFGDAAQLASLLDRLARNRTEVHEMRDSTIAAAPEQTWLARARTVADTLEALR